MLQTQFERCQSIFRNFSRSPRPAVPQSKRWHDASKMTRLRKDETAIILLKTVAYSVRALSVQIEIPDRRPSIRSFLRLLQRFLEFFLQQL